MVEIFFEDTEILDLDPEFFVSWLSVCVERNNHVLGELSLIFCSDSFLLELNKRHLNHDYYTDIITFDYSEGGVVSGDLFISIDRVKENAEGLNVSFENELHRVVSHGVLHLLGFKDKSSEDVLVMRSKEDECLGLIVPRET